MLPDPAAEGAGLDDVCESGPRPLLKIVQRDAAPDSGGLSQAGLRGGQSLAHRTPLRWHRQEDGGFLSSSRALASLNSAALRFTGSGAAAVSPGRMATADATAVA